MMAFKSEASMTKFVGAVTMPWTKLALISPSLEIRPANLVQCLLWVLSLIYTVSPYKRHGTRVSDELCLFQVASIAEMLWRHE